MIEVILMAHVVCGVACLVTALWVFVDVLNVTETNSGTLTRIRWISRASAICMWLAFFMGGYWYVVFYPADKAIILKGPWPFAHNFFMETKEHLVIMLLLLTTYLPIAARGNLASSVLARRLVLWTSGMVAALALVADSFGAVIAMGVKVALLAKHN